ncbi:pyridoxal-dependent decarboxylase conserved domain-containing protein [Lipomyces japonicus]|uniref:pyridoxal-dependent decarboxylase conserved domain-containing protein n=1 Tax=Lipomyces japonicus TaxID=56871 RepID=UPI0034CD1458
MDPEEFRKAAYQSIDYIVDYYKSLQSRPVVSEVSPGYLRNLLPEDIPQDPESWDTILNDFNTKIVPGLTHWQSPNFLAFFPANTSFPSILGETFSAAFSAPAFNWICSPAVTELETIVLEWLAKLLALPKAFHSVGQGGGVIQGSASEAVVVAMIAARDRYLRDMVAAKYDDERKREAAISAARGRLVAFASDQTHSSTHKAAIVAGVKFISIPTWVENQYSLTGASLLQAIEEADKQGLLPFFLTASLGTTAICAVDRFDEIAQVTADRPEIWKHIDAAYAGAALICPEFQHYLNGVGDHYDSFDMNLHKWLLVNFDASCLYVRNRSNLTQALTLTPTYLRNSATDSGLVIDYRDWQIPLGRRFRALKVWFVFRTFGATGLRKHIYKSLAVGQKFTDAIKTRPDLFSIVTEPRFGLTVFQVLPNKDKDNNNNHETANDVTKRVAEQIDKDGYIFLTVAVVDGKVSIRVVSGSPWATEENMGNVFAYILKVSEHTRNK